MAACRHLDSAGAGGGDTAAPRACRGRSHKGRRRQRRTLAGPASRGRRSHGRRSVRRRLQTFRLAARPALAGERVCPPVSPHTRCRRAATPDQGWSATAPPSQRRPTAVNSRLRARSRMRSAVRAAAAMIVSVGLPPPRGREDRRAADVERGHVVAPAVRVDDGCRRPDACGAAGVRRLRPDGPVRHRRRADDPRSRQLSGRARA